MQKKLYRIPSQGKITGLSAGLSEYLSIDVTVVRIIWVVLAFVTSGFAVLMYFVIALMVPVSGDKHSTVEFGQRVNEFTEEVSSKVSSNSLRNYLGVGLILVGLWYMIGVFWPGLLAFRWEIVWPILLMVMGLLILTRKEN